MQFCTKWHPKGGFECAKVDCLASSAAVFYFLLLITPKLEVKSH